MQTDAPQDSCDQMTRDARLQAILLDIEGTTSSISFVYDVMFPFVRERLDSFLNQHWNDRSVQEAISLLAGEAGCEGLTLGQAEAEVIRLMDADVKSTGLKQLQGLIWRSGFESGQLVAHLYDDVLPAIERWKASGLEVRIYSSGSIEAQKLFFGHSIAGNLLSRFSGHYDTTIGSKRESTSYQKIAQDIGLPAATILFISDVVAELDAASAVGMQTRLSVRPGNPQQPPSNHICIASFAEV